MLATLCVSLTLLAPRQAPAAAPPAIRYALDVRDAPTAAVFAMMLGGNEVTVMRHFPTLVTLRLTKDQLVSPPPDPKRSYDGDYPAIAGWLVRLDRAMGLHRLVVGLEREGGAFYVSEADKPNAAGADLYRGFPESPDQAWHRVWPTGNGYPVPPPLDAAYADLRLAGVRWSEGARDRGAVLVVRSKVGEAFARVVREGDPMGVAGLKAENIEPSVITLTGPQNARVRLDLRGDPR